MSKKKNKIKSSGPIREVVSSDSFLNKGIPFNKVEVIGNKYTPDRTSRKRPDSPIIFDDPRYTKGQEEIREKNSVQREKRDGERPRLVKASGHKSAFRVKNDLITTSFGRGNAAVLEKYLPENSMPINLLEKGNSAYNIRLKDERTEEEHPLENPFQKADEVQPIRKDQIGAKDELEMRYFGRTFNDNIHIQIIYNILDIDKVLAVHINDIIFSINNLRKYASPSGQDGKAIEELDAGQMDLLGDKLYISHPYNKIRDAENQRFDPDEKKHQRNQKNAINFRNWFDALSIDPRMGYFGASIYDGKAVSDWKKTRKKSDNPKDEQKSSMAQEKLDNYRKRLYYYLLLLGLSRQSLAHSKKENRDILYRFSAYGDGISKKEMNSWPEAYKILSECYDKKVEDLNRNFFERAKHNLTAFLPLFDAETSAEKEFLVRQFYGYEVRKEGKNLGFSLKRLREFSLDLSDENATAVREQLELAKRNPNNGQFPNHHKFNKGFDFLLFNYYTMHQKEADAMVESLRAAAKQTKRKEEIYRREAARLWELFGTRVRMILMPNVCGNNYDKAAMEKKADRTLSDDMLAGIKITSSVSTFSKLIYLFTLFLDGKEINILLTSLIHYFESIGSFLQVIRDAQEKGLPVEDAPFLPAYGMFQNSWTRDKFGRISGIAKELREINSFARMTSSSDAPDVKEIMYVDAAEVLGDNGSEEDLKNYIHDLLEKDKDGKPKRGNNHFRNFIANNVVTSDRFRYIIRYGDPRKLKALISNEKLTAFVLDDIPDDQIIRYYSAVGGTLSPLPEKDPESGKYREKDAPVLKKMRDELTKKLTSVQFLDFENVPQEPDKETDPAKKEKMQTEKQEMQAIIRLYLTVLYLVTKNLVYINARYFMGFHRLEKDAFLLLENDTAPINPLYKLTKNFLEDGKIKRKQVQKYLDCNLNNCEKNVVVEFRNKVMHMNAVSDAQSDISDLKEISSYFALYHFIMQKQLQRHFKNTEIKAKTKQYFNLLDVHGTYNKDFVKALCIPFGYNLPRYKNLTIEALFDRNRLGELKEEECTL